MKKIGLLLITLVFALGALGVGFAAWTDEIYIEGTVNTGDVDINITELSGTEVWKDFSDDSLVYVHTVFGDPVEGQRPANGLLVAEATAVSNGQVADGDGAIFTFINLFPCQDFYVDMVLEYEGSVPGKINYADFTSMDMPEELEGLWLGVLDPNSVTPETIGIWLEGYGMRAGGEPFIVTLGTQLHVRDIIYLELHIHLPQDNALMNLDGSFAATIQVIQWNEFDMYNGVLYPPA